MSFATSIIYIVLKPSMSLDNEFVGFATSIIYIVLKLSHVNFDRIPVLLPA